MRLCCCQTRLYSRTRRQR